VLKDHQGSLTGLANASGQLSERYSYDAFGRRRNANTWDYDQVAGSTITARGYTFHEHMDAFGLINMNGRVYDPLVGQMLSPDPFIQQPENSQSYNRYGYVLNNPLRFVDPSGYFAEGDSTGITNRPLMQLYLPINKDAIPYITNTDIALSGPDVFSLKVEKEEYTQGSTRAGEAMSQTLLLSAQASRFPPAALIVLASGSLLTSYYILSEKPSIFAFSNFTCQIDARSGNDWKKREDRRGQKLQRDILERHRNMLNNGGVNNQGFPEDPNGIIPKGGGALFITLKILELYLNWDSALSPKPIPSSTKLDKDTRTILINSSEHRP
jgi:RHS repeat-associated protein